MKQTLSLDGTWQVIYDQDNKGRTLNWQHQGDFQNYHDIEEVSVPACLEEFKQDYEGVAWYGKTFIRPTDWENKTIRIRFEAVNYRAEIWINGEAVGAHEGGYTGFEFQIDDLLIEGETVKASSTYTGLQNQDFQYASGLAANKLAERIVELMETKW